LWLSQNGNVEEIVDDARIERALRTVAPKYVVRVRETAKGPIYRVTKLGQIWAVLQLRQDDSSWTSLTHRFANITRTKMDVLAVEERRIGRKAEWRVTDKVRRVRTPWLASDVRTLALERAAKTAVRRTDLAKLTSRHTRDGDWVIVHAL
jgi:hypothetical protein